MAKLTEISEKPSANKEDYLTDTDDDVQLNNNRINADIEDEISDDEEAILKETLYDRLVALQDMLPEHTREKYLKTISKYASQAKSVAKVVGQLAWIVTTSALVLVLPLLFEMETENEINAWEQEQLLQQKNAQKALQPVPAIPAMPTPAGLQK